MSRCINIIIFTFLFLYFIFNKYLVNNLYFVKFKNKKLYYNNKYQIYKRKMSNYTCPKCKDNFKYPSLLKRHLQQSVRCVSTNEFISNLFVENNNIVNVNIDNIIESPLFMCNDCKSEFKYKTSLYKHKRISRCSKTKISNDIDNTLTTTIITNETNNTEIINNDTINNDITSFKYIYLIEKFDVNNKEYIYKFGKTNREYSKRLKEHGDEAKLLLILDVDNCNVMEKKILNILSNTENIRKCSFGNEYFLCNDKEYIKSIILKNIYN